MLSDVKKAPWNSTNPSFLGREEGENNTRLVSQVAWNTMRRGLDKNITGAEKQCDSFWPNDPGTGAQEE